jgi:transcriptional regulator with XRE-family HTH domain
METVGQRVRRLRRDAGLSQRELAGPGVSYAYISRIEGDARKPSVKALRVLARKLDVTATYLETGEDRLDVELRRIAAVTGQALTDAGPCAVEPLEEIASSLGRLGYEVEVERVVGVS